MTGVQELISDHDIADDGRVSFDKMSSNIEISAVVFLERSDIMLTALARTSI